MRWGSLAADQENAPGLFAMDAVARTFVTPDFHGMTFYEIRAKSILNRVSKASKMPFRWTINPYRGCSHKCRYCFARPTHDYLGFNIGEDFDSKIVVKVNAAELLRTELSRASWTGESIAMGTNVDPYQRAEGKYQLMPAILEQLVARANPFSILTKGSLILRDIDLLTAAAQRAQISVGVSVGSLDSQLWRAVEAGAPSPKARLRVVAALAAAGLRCNVLMAPILPFLSDSDEQLEGTVSAIAAAGAQAVIPLVLHLRPGVREWFWSWLENAHPEHVSGYRRLYSRGAYVPREFSADIAQRVAKIAASHGMGERKRWRSKQPQEESPAQAAAVSTQLSLL